MSKGSILVTGANGGLGSAIVTHILKTPSLADSYTGVYTVRNEATATGLHSALSTAPCSHNHVVIGLDLSSLAQIRSVVENINNRIESGEIPPIRALILNAAYQDQTDIVIGQDGFEMTWQVNYLANLVLTLLLLQSMDKERGRIVLLGSWSHDIADKRNEIGGVTPWKDAKWQTFAGAESLAKGAWSTPQDDPSRLSGYRRYGASKLCAIMFMYELALRLAKEKALARISVIGLDPGAMGSDLTRRGNLLLRFLTAKVLMHAVASVAVRANPNGAFRPLWKSAEDVLAACFDLEPPHARKLLYLNGSEEQDTAAAVKDATLRRDVWDYGVRVAGIKTEDTLLGNWQ